MSCVAITFANICSQIYLVAMRKLDFAALTRLHLCKFETYAINLCNELAKFWFDVLQIMLFYLCKCIENVSQIILFYLCKCIEYVKNGKDKLEEYFLFQNNKSNFML